LVNTVNGFTTKDNTFSLGQLNQSHGIDQELLPIDLGAGLKAMRSITNLKVDSPGQCPLNESFAEEIVPLDGEIQGDDVDVGFGAALLEKLLGG
jgi:hypothetical protein